MSASPSLGQVIIRPGEPADAAFVHSSWLKSYQHGGRTAVSGQIAPNVYAPGWAATVGPMCYLAEHSGVIKRLMDRSDISVAAWSEDPETIIGWAAIEPCPGTLPPDSDEPYFIHYCFVRKEFRRQGVARRLLSGTTAPAIVTHRTADADRCPWPRGWTYNPYPGLR